MSELLSYFFRPEESVSELLIGREKGKWKQGLLYWLMISILVGFATMAIYRLNHIAISDILGSDFKSLLQNTFGVEMGEGTVWLVSSIVFIIQTLLLTGIKCLIWIGALFIANLILKEKFKIYDILLLSMFAMTVRLTAQVFTVIAVAIASLCPIDIINQMIIGISMILEYWYLIILGIGFTVGTKSTFLKGGIAVLIIQGIFWTLSGLLPGFQLILG